ncbi:MAG: hypothetical protein C0608_01915 [Deltaproteobacteria bacterium]|nr:MAG: hypothetical protein C0608_01915 [Deltaproteobacteria bacterium]
MALFTIWFVAFEVAHPVGDMIHCHTHHHDAVQFGSITHSISSLIACFINDEAGEGFHHSHGDMVEHYHTADGLYPSVDTLTAGLDHSHDFAPIPLGSAHANDDSNSSHDEIILYETAQFEPCTDEVNWTLYSSSEFPQFLPELSSPIPIT